MGDQKTVQVKRRFVLGGGCDRPDQQANECHGPEESVCGLHGDVCGANKLIPQTFLSRPRLPVAGAIVARESKRFSARTGFFQYRTAMCVTLRVLTITESLSIARTRKTGVEGRIRAGATISVPRTGGLLAGLLNEVLAVPAARGRP